jgi:hypothetical protein
MFDTAKNGTACLTFASDILSAIVDFAFVGRMLMLSRLGCLRQR